MRYPVSGGAYVYGRERLGPFWGYLAGWAFIVGKTASCAAMALTVGFYLWPAHAHLVALSVVVVVTVINCAGVQKSAGVTRLIVLLVLAVLAGVVAATVHSGHWEADRLSHGVPGSIGGLLQAAGLLFFAFALQCMSTVAVMRRETNSWKWPLTAFAGLLVIAYTAAFIGNRVFTMIAG